MIPATSLAFDLVVRSTLLLAAALLATRWLRRAAPVLAATAHNLCLAGLLALPILVFCGPSLRWPVLRLRPAAIVEEASRVERQVPPQLKGETDLTSRREPSNQPIQPARIERATIGEPPARRETRVVAKPAVVTGPATTLHAPPRERPAPTAFRLPTIPNRVVVAVTYGMGCLVLLSRVVLGLWRLRGLVHESMPVRQKDWLDEMEHWRNLLGLKRSVRLVMTDAVKTPMTLGWIRPVVVIPAALERTATADQRRAAVLHELIHVRRRDFPWQLLLRIVEALYWFHPLQWLLSRSVTATRELACDAVCARHLGTACYANALVELAGRFSKSPVPAVGLAMARTSKLRGRLQALHEIEPSGQVLPSAWQLVAIAVPVALLVIGFGSLAPVVAQAPPPKPAATGNAPARGGPVVFSGRLIDERAEPFRDAAVEVRVVVWTPGAGSKDVAHSLKSDRDGRFSFDLSVGTNAQANYEIELSSPASMPKTIRMSSDEARKGILGDIKTPRLVEKTARVFDPNGEPVAGARVEAVATGGERSEMNTPLHTRVETDKEGRFKVRVPESVDVGLMVRSDRGAVARVVVAAGGKGLSDIRLEKGAALIGRVVDRGGRPVRGGVVSLQSDDDQTVRTELEVGGGLLDIRDVRITDAEGRFRFPPLLGDFVVSLVPRRQAFREGSEDYKKAIDPPPMVPVSVHLDAPGEKAITLIEAPTATIGGTIRWRDGKPVAGVSVGCMLSPRRGNAYINLGQATSDAQGRYSLRVPLPLDALIVTVQPQAGPDGKTWVPSPADPKPGAGRSLRGQLVIGHFDGDRTDLDWKLAPPEERPGRAVANEGGRDGAAAVSPDLIALEGELVAALRAYQDAEKRALTEEEKDRLEALDSRNVMVGRCLEFEARHRGTRDGIGALHWVMRAGATISYPTVRKARIDAIAILRDHYVAHADVDLLINEFTAGTTPLEAEPLLRKFAAESPHNYVRVAALYELGEVLAALPDLDKIYASAETLTDAMIAGQPSERTKAYLRDQRDSARQLHKGLAGRDPKEMKAEAVRLFDQIATHFSDIGAPGRRWEGPEDIRLVDVDPGKDPTFRRWSIPEQAEIKQFQMTKLQLGQPAPILEGTDLHQKRIRLSDFAGKVVVLTVTMGTVGDRELYDRCKTLLDKFQGQPVACLSVIPSDGDGGYSVREIVRETGITWPILRDTRGGALARRWCQVTFPEVYVIDTRGVIRLHQWASGSGGAGVSAKIKEILKEPKTP